MDAFIDTLIQLLIDWGYAGLFISALLAGSIIPFSSELVMLALVKVGLNPAICVLAATLGTHNGRYDLLLHGTSRQDGLDRKIFQSEARKNRQNAAFPAR